EVIMRWINRLPPFQLALLRWQGRYAHKPEAPAKDILRWRFRLVCFFDAGVIALLILLTPVAARADAPLPAGVKAVWDLAKAQRNATPTRERVCLNGLWRWQPAGRNAESVPTDQWGY